MGIAVFPAAGGGVTQKTQEFTSTGTFTVPSNCSSVSVLLVGGGGGAGGSRVLNGTTGIICGGGGGGGGVIERTVTVTPGASITVTIGAGGAGGIGGSTFGGSVGSDSTFGTLLTAKGGGSGNGWNDGGTQTTANLAINGATGGGSAGRSAGGTDTSGGGGGGAGGNGYTMFRDSAGIFGANFSDYFGASAGLNGGGHGTVGQFGTNRGFSYAGPGVNGFGGGGAAGQWPDTTLTNTRRLAFGATLGGVIWGVSNTTANGVNGTANTGNGGGGSVSCGNGSATRDATGGNGGSGYCLVTFWS